LTGGRKASFVLITSKLILLGILTAVCGSVVFCSPAAAGNGGYVSGYVTAGGTPVSDLKVSVTCVDLDGNAFTHHPTTSSTGAYGTQFSDGDCVQGAGVTVSADQNDASGIVKGSMDSSLYLQNLDLDLMSVAVPEFVPVTMFIATVVVLAGLYSLRRKTAAE
jgi:hypothetical protein